MRIGSLLFGPLKKLKRGSEYFSTADFEGAERSRIVRRATSIKGPMQSSQWSGGRFFEFQLRCEISSPAAIRIIWKNRLHTSATASLKKFFLVFTQCLLRNRTSEDYDSMLR